MSDKTTGIFVVLATVDHEASDPVRAFARKEDADALVKQCRDYEDAHKRSPEMDAPEEEWDAWLEANRAWEAAHPAAPFIRRDYCAVPVPFVQAASPHAVTERVAACLKALRDGCDENMHGIAVTTISGHTVKVKKNGAGAKRWFINGVAHSQAETAFFIAEKFHAQADPE